MADKYYKNADATTERIYGKTEIFNTEYMNLLENKNTAEEEEQSDGSN